METFFKRWRRNIFRNDTSTSSPCSKTSSTLVNTGLTGYGDSLLSTFGHKLESKVEWLSGIGVIKILSQGPLLFMWTQIGLFSLFQSFLNINIRTVGRTAADEIRTAPSLPTDPPPLPILLFVFIYLWNDVLQHLCLDYPNINVS